MLMLIEGVIGFVVVVALLGATLGLLQAAVVSIKDFHVIEILYVVVIFYFNFHAFTQMLAMCFLGIWCMLNGRFDKALLVAIVTTIWINLWALQSPIY